MTVTDREYGELVQQVKAMEKAIDEIRHDVKEGNAVTDQILLKLSQVAGGWKVLIAVGGIAAAIGAMVVKFLPLIFPFAE